MRATFAFAGVEGHASATRPMLFLILGAHVSEAEFMYPDKSWKETSGMLANLVAETSNGEMWGFTTNGKIISTQAW